MTVHDTPGASASRRASRDEAPAPRPLRAEAPPLLAIGAASALAAALFLNGRLADWGGDNVQYMLLAEAIVRGKGYVNLYLPGTPFHAHYPPLFPLLLAPLVAAGASLLAIKAFAALLSFAGLAVAYLYLRPVCGRGVALLCVLSTLASCVFLDAGLAGMSDGPYLLASFAALAAVRRAFARGGRGAAVLAGILVGAAILTRTVGLVFLPALALHALLRGRPGDRPYRTAAWIVAAACVVAGPWFGAVVAHRGLDRVGYVREFTNSEPAERPAANVRDLGERVADTPLPAALRDRGVVTDAARAGYVLVCGVSAVLVLAGFARALARRRGIEDAYALAYAAVLAFWLPGGFRLLLPLYPLLLLWLYEGVVTAGGLLRRDATRLARLVLVGTIAANVLVTFSFPRIERRLSGEYAPWWNDYLRTVCDVGALARPGDTVLARPANVPFYLAGMQAVRLRAADRDDPVEGVVRSGARYVVLTPGLRGALGPEFANALRRTPDRFAPVARAGAVEAFAVLPNLPGGPPSAPAEWSPRCRALVPR